MVGTHYFIDESKAKSYLVVAAACPDASLSTARRAIGKLVLPGQRSIHMKSESARRRNQIASVVCDLRGLGVRAVVVDAGRGPEPEYLRRARALHAIVLAATSQPASSLVIDLDQTLLARDAHTLSESIRACGADSMTYSHQPFAAQPLLAIPDVIAWCWARGGDWRRRIAPIVTASIDV